MKELIIITGYLGAGKTSTLKHVLKTVPSTVKLGIVVNEFATLSIDTGLVEQEGLCLKELSNGCVCCTKGHELHSTLKKLADKKDIQTVILETTGLASIQPLLDHIADTGFNIRSIITVIDAQRYASTKGFGILSKTQVEKSGTLIINKTDLVDAPVIARLKNEIKSINQTAAVLEAQHGNVDFLQLYFGNTQPEIELRTQTWAQKTLRKFFPEIGRDTATKHLAKSGMKSISFSLTTPIDRQKFDAFITKQTYLERAKGFLNFAGDTTTYEFQYAAGLVTLEPFKHVKLKSEIVLIGSFSHIKRLALFKELISLQSKPAPKELITNLGLLVGINSLPQ